MHDEKELTLEEFQRIAQVTRPLVGEMAAMILQSSLYTEQGWMDTAIGWEKRLRAAFSDAVNKTLDQFEIAFLSQILNKLHRKQDNELIN